jgi:3-dehydroquinate dehydratase
MAATFSASSTPLSLNQLLTGLFSVLAQRGISTISIRTDRVDEVLVQVYEQLEKTADAESVELTFQIRQGLHGTSSQLRRALKLAALRDRVSIDNPEYQDIRLSESKLPYEHLSRLPGSEKMYEELADTFLAAYEPDSFAHP